MFKTVSKLRSEGHLTFLRHQNHICDARIGFVAFFFDTEHARPVLISDTWTDIRQPENTRQRPSVGGPCQRGGQSL
jgi:hypothetical protein